MVSVAFAVAGVFAAFRRCGYGNGFRLAHVKSSLLLANPFGAQIGARFVMVQRVLMASVIMLLLDLLGLMRVDRRILQLADDVAQIFIRHKRSLFSRLGMGKMMQGLRAFVQMTPVVGDERLHFLRALVDRDAVFFDVG